MTALDRRTLMAVTVAGIATPTTLGAKECPTMDWITMSLEARNLAYNNVEHVGPRTRARKPKSGPQLRRRCASSAESTSTWLMETENATSGTYILRMIRR